MTRIRTPWLPTTTLEDAFGGSVRLLAFCFAHELFQESFVSADIFYHLISPPVFLFYDDQIASSALLVAVPSYHPLSRGAPAGGFTSSLAAQRAPA